MSRSRESSVRREVPVSNSTAPDGEDVLGAPPAPAATSALPGRGRTQSACRRCRRQGQPLGAVADGELAAQRPRSGDGGLDASPSMPGLSPRPSGTLPRSTSTPPASASGSAVRRGACERVCEVAARRARRGAPSAAGCHVASAVGVLRASESDDACARGRRRPMRARTAVRAPSASEHRAASRRARLARRAISRGARRGLGLALRCAAGCRRSRTPRTLRRERRRVGSRSASESTTPRSGARPGRLRADVRRCRARRRPGPPSSPADQLSLDLRPVATDAGEREQAQACEGEDPGRGTRHGGRGRVKDGEGPRGKMRACTYPCNSYRERGMGLRESSGGHGERAPDIQFTRGKETPRRPPRV